MIALAILHGGELVDFFWEVIAVVVGVSAIVVALRLAKRARLRKGKLR